MAPQMDDATATWYADRYGDHVTNAMSIAEAELGPDDVLLDIGCGTGAALAAAACGRRIGVDPTAVMVDRARDRLGEQAEIHQASAEALPLPDAEITVALAINSLHHWDDAAAGLAEVRRVLAPGGRFLVTEEDLGGRMGHGSGPLARPEVVVALLQQAGFTDVALRRVDGEVAMLVVAARR